METLLDEKTVELIRDYVPRNATLHMLSEFSERVRTPRAPR